MQLKRYAVWMIVIVLLSVVYENILIFFNSKLKA